MNFETTIEHGLGEETDPVIAQGVQFFHKMLDTIAAATQLARDVKALSEEVAKLRAEVEEVHTRNMQLTEAINVVRTERDNFASEVAHLRSELAQAKAEAEYERNRANGLDTAYANFRDEHANMMANHHEVNSRQENTIAEISTERDALRKELAETQGSFRILEEKVRGLVGSLSAAAGEAGAESIESEPLLQVSNWQ